MIYAGSMLLPRGHLTDINRSRKDWKSLAFAQGCKGIATNWFTMTRRA